MVNRKFPFEKLKDQNILERFNEDLLSKLALWEYSVLSVCLDKKTLKETYTVWRYDPYHYCLEVLLERFYFFLDRRNAVGDVMTESRGGKEDVRLKNTFERLWERGSHFIEPAQFQRVFTSRQLKVKPKTNNIAGLQLADLIAHPSRNEILQEKGLLTGEMGAFAKKVVEILQGKYDNDQGRMFGKKFL